MQKFVYKYMWSIRDTQKYLRSLTTMSIQKLTVNIVVTMVKKNNFTTSK
jgi:hypothetical protein